MQASEAMLASRSQGGKKQHMIFEFLPTESYLYSFNLILIKMTNNEYLIIDVYFAAGKSLSKLMKTYFRDDDQALIDWFYEPRDSFGGRSPNEICEEGKQSDLEDLLLCMALGGSGCS